MNIKSSYNSENIYFDTFLHESPMRVRTAKQIEQIKYDERNYEKKLLQKMSKMVKLCAVAKKV